MGRAIFEEQSHRMRNPRGGGGSGWLWLLGIGGVVAYFASKSSAQAAPLAIYPEYGYTAQTSMAATPKQKATQAMLPPTPLFASVQQQEQAALYTQCAGSNVCSIVSPDTALGL